MNFVLTTSVHPSVPSINYLGFLFPLQDHLTRQSRRLLPLLLFNYNCGRAESDEADKGPFQLSPLPRPPCARGAAGVTFRRRKVPRSSPMNDGDIYKGEDGRTDGRRAGEGRRVVSLMCDVR